MTAQHWFEDGIQVGSSGGNLLVSNNIKHMKIPQFPLNLFHQDNNCIMHNSMLQNVDRYRTKVFSHSCSRQGMSAHELQSTHEIPLYFLCTILSAETNAWWEHTQKMWSSMLVFEKQMLQDFCHFYWGFLGHFQNYAKPVSSMFFENLFWSVRQGQLQTQAWNFWVAFKIALLWWSSTRTVRVKIEAVSGELCCCAGH
jgi:hypothetical protein